MRYTHMSSTQHASIMSTCLKILIYYNNKFKGIFLLQHVYSRLKILPAAMSAYSLQMRNILSPIGMLYKVLSV